MTKTNTQLRALNGNKLAKLFNSLDFENDYELYTKVEKELNFRYEDWFINQLLENNL